MSVGAVDHDVVAVRESAAPALDQQVVAPARRRQDAICGLVDRLAANIKNDRRGRRSDEIRQ